MKIRVREWENFTKEFNEQRNKEILEKYKGEIEFFKNVDENTTLGELSEMFGNEYLFIVLGNNCSGVDVLNYDTEEIEEWTW